MKVDGLGMTPCVDVSPNNRHLFISFYEFDYYKKNASNKDWQEERNLKRFYHKPGTSIVKEIDNPVLSDSLTAFWHPFENYYLTFSFTTEENSQDKTIIFKVSVPDIEVTDLIEIERGIFMKGHNPEISPDGKGFFIRIDHENILVDDSLSTKLKSKICDLLQGDKNYLFIKYDNKEFKFYYSGHPIWLSENEIIYCYKEEIIIRNLSTETCRKIKIPKGIHPRFRKLLEGTVLIETSEYHKVNNSYLIDGDYNPLTTKYYFLLEPAKETLKPFHIPSSFDGKVCELGNNCYTIMETKKEYLAKYLVDSNKNVTKIGEIALKNTYPCIPSRNAEREFYVEIVDYENRIFTIYELKRKEFFLEKLLTFEVEGETISIKKAVM